MIHTMLANGFRQRWQFVYYISTQCIRNSTISLLFISAFDWSNCPKMTWTCLSLVSSFRFPWTNSCRPKITHWEDWAPSDAKIWYDGSSEYSLKCGWNCLCFRRKNFRIDFDVQNLSSSPQVFAQCLGVKLGFGQGFVFASMYQMIIRIGFDQMIMRM